MMKIDYFNFDCRVSINQDRGISIRDVSREDLKKISKKYNIKIDERNKTRWIQFGNITIFQK